MTKIIGRPNNYGPNVPLKLVIREDIPYRSAGLGVSLGHYEAEASGEKWILTGGAELSVLMPRFDQYDSPALGSVQVFISRKDTGAVVAKYPFNPSEWVETAPGVFDLARAGGGRAWLRPLEFEELRDGALGAKAGAEAAAQSVTAAQLDLTAERERVAQALADTAQMQADWATAPRTLLHGTAAQRRALVVDPPRRVLFLEDDTRRQLNYFPGVGWRDVYGNDPDAAPPPPDTGVY